MHPNAQIIQSFYTSFQNLDSNGMKKCYHPDIQFSDPAFSSLKGKEVSAMWAMLIDNLKKGKQRWQLEFDKINATDEKGSCHWEAHYTLSATGRKVHNVINASFHFKDGLIVRHIDSFDFYRWARMGFGISGVLLGWTPFFKNKVRSRVKRLLDRYIKNHPE